MFGAAFEGNVEAIKQVQKWQGFDEIYEELFKYHHKRQFYRKIYEELFKYHHKRQFYRKIDEELLSIAWHPDRAIDWCFDEDEKKDLQILWGNCDS